MLYAKAPIALALTAVSYTVLIFLQPGLIGIALCLVGLVVGATLTAFCVMHDANHGAYFKKRRWNHLVGWSSDLLLGFSSYAWRVKHNVAHHTYTNVEGFDDDATQAPLARFTAEPARAALVPLPAVLHLADVHADGAPLADWSATSRRSAVAASARARSGRRAAGTSSASSPGRRSSSRGRS